MSFCLISNFLPFFFYLPGIDFVSIVCLKDTEMPLWIFYFFIYFIGVSCHIPEYFTYVTAASIMVGGNQALTEGTPHYPQVGCWSNHSGSTHTAKHIHWGTLLTNSLMQPPLSPLSNMWGSMAWKHTLFTARACSLNTCSTKHEHKHVHVTFTASLRKPLSNFTPKSAFSDEQIQVIKNSFSFENFSVRVSSYLSNKSQLLCFLSQICKPLRIREN